MSSIAFTWLGGKPPRPDVYTTRRGMSSYHTLRYWDGARWWQIDWTRNRGATPFEWPKGSRTRFPGSHLSAFRKTMGLRNINAQDIIQWGTPYRVYDDKEVLAYLVKTGRLQKDWRTLYQNEMRIEDHREIRA